MSIKKKIFKLERQMNLKFLEFHGKFYSNRRNFYIHLGLDKSLFSFQNYKIFLQEIDNFFNEHVIKDFETVFPPKLVISTKWKDHYILYRKKLNND